MRALVLVVVAMPAIAQADPAVCAKPDAEASKARLTADAVEACFDATCLRLPFATKKWELGKDWAEASAPPAAGKPEAVTVCVKPGVACRAVELDPVNGKVVANAARTLVALVGPPVPVTGVKGAGEEEPILLFDVAAQKQVATLHGWRTPMGNPAAFQQLKFLGDTLYATISYTPVSSQGRLFDGKTGRQLATIGGADQDVDETAVVELGKGTYAFGAFAGAKVLVYDAATGRSHPSIALAAPKSTATIAQLALFQRTADGALLVVLRGDAQSGVTLIDTQSRNGQRVGVPHCR